MIRDCTEFKHDGCPVTETVRVNIGVPVAIRGFADIGKVRIKCEGHEIIPGTDFPGEHDAVKEFVICQKIKVKIPVVFSATADVCKAIVNFNGCDDDSHHNNGDDGNGCCGDNNGNGCCDDDDDQGCNQNNSQGNGSDEYRRYR